jgi:hypothetical protein
MRDPTMPRRTVRTTLALLDRSADCFFLFRAARLCSPARVDAACSSVLCTSREATSTRQRQQAVWNGWDAFISVDPPTGPAGQQKRPEMQLLSRGAVPLFLKHNISTDTHTCMSIYPYKFTRIYHIFMSTSEILS